MNDWLRGGLRVTGNELPHTTDRQQHHAGVEHGDVQVLAFAAALASQQRSQDLGERHVASETVDTEPATLGWNVVGSATPHHACHCLDGVVRCRAEPLISPV